MGICICLVLQSYKFLGWNRAIYIRNIYFSKTIRKTKQKQLKTIKNEKIIRIIIRFDVINIM